MNQVFSGMVWIQLPSLPSGALGANQMVTEPRCHEVSNGKTLKHFGAGWGKHSKHMGINFNQGPSGGHHLGGGLCPPTTFSGVPYLKTWPYMETPFGQKVFYHTYSSRGAIGIRLDVGMANGVSARRHLLGLQHGPMLGIVDHHGPEILGGHIGRQGQRVALASRVCHFP